MLVREVEAASELPLLVPPLWSIQKKTRRMRTKQRRS